LRRFLDRQTAEVAQLEDPALALIEGHQILERRVDGDHLLRPFVGDDRDVFQSDSRSAPAALRALTRTRVVHQNVPHDLSSHRKEVASRLVARLFVGDQTEVRLVHERRGLQQMIGALRPHVVRGKAPQLLVDDGQQPVESGLVPCAPLGQQTRGFPRNQRLEMA
jgi:hypothetical protein